jgi:YggT family protein
MGSPLADAGLFLIHTIFNMAIMVVILRWALARRRANFFNPLSQLAMKLTDPVLEPLRKVVPRSDQFDFPLLVLLLLVILIKLLLISFIQVGSFPNIVGLVFWVFADLVKQSLNFVFYATLIWVVLSWMANPSTAPLQQSLDLILSPIMEPLQRVIPPVAGFDLSPLVLLLGLQVASIILVRPLMGIALALSF